MKAGATGRSWRQIVLLLWLALSYLMVLIDGLGNLAYAADLHDGDVGIGGGLFLLMILICMTLDILRLHSDGMLRWGSRY